MSLWVLDTDTVSALLRGHTGVAARVEEKSPDQLAITIVTIEELLSGWYARIRQAKSDEALEHAYLALQQSVQFASHVNVLRFDILAIARFNQLRNFHRRIGTNDLKIAAIALQNQGTLVSRNTADFSSISGLRTENWAE